MKAVTKSTIRSLLTLLCFGFSACSAFWITHEDVAKDAFAGVPLTLDVFSARGFLGGSDYERYYVTDSLVWRECGNIARAPEKTARGHLEGDEVLQEDPSLEIRQRRVENLSRAQQAMLKEKASALITSLDSNDVETPPPGSFFSLSDPGLFELSVKLGTRKKRVITSVDAVADKTSLQMQQAHELFALLRGVGPTICESPTFFGISRRELQAAKH